MPIANSIVDRIRRLTPVKPTQDSCGPHGPVIRVEFVDVTNEPVLFDASGERGEAWAWILNSAFMDHEPVFVMFNPATRYIVDFHCPHRSRIGAITPVGERIHVELIESSARHFLDPQHGDYGHMLDILRQAMQSGRAMIVTDDPHTHQILDVRPDPFFVPIRFAEPPPSEAPGAPLRSVPSGPPSAPSGPPSAPSVVTMIQAEDLFDLVSATSCAPAHPLSPCIPFLFPNNYCWARAHEMCRLIIGDGVQPTKLWVNSAPGTSLVVVTPNDLDCEVKWSWHVAPVVDVDDSGTIEQFVLDPSLFDAPSLVVDWFQALGNAGASTTSTDATVYRRRFDGSLEYEDPMYPYAKTRQDLRAARRRLRKRSIDDGPPPYSQCLIGSSPGNEAFATNLA